MKPMLLSLDSSHFQHQGAHCHVIAGYSGPKSVRRIEVPQKRMRGCLLQLLALSFNVLIFFFLSMQQMPGKCFN